MTPKEGRTLGLAILYLTFIPLLLAFTINLDIVVNIALIISIVGIISGGILVGVYWKCPWCKERLPETRLANKAIDYCPYCKESINFPRFDKKSDK